MLQSFENDIFISYAHIDNLPLAEGETGWVTHFHRALEVRLRQLLGGQARIWRDAKLQGNDVFGDALLDKFPGVALLVSILSPRYIQSEWCLREVDAFRQAAAERLQVGEKSRLFKVVKTYVPLEQQPDLMQAMLGYEFYQLDPATGRPREFKQETGPNKDPRYWDQLEDLAYELADLLKILKTNALAEATPAAGATEREAIYLAPTTSDLKAEYDAIKREFQQRGHPVLPDKPLPYSAPEVRETVAEQLRRCQVSVHLIGQHYGMIPEAAEQSIVELQNTLAAAHCRSEPGFARLIWLPPELQVQEPRQQSFVQTLETDAEAQFGADLLRTDLGELKMALQNVLDGRQQADTALVDSDEPPQVYVIYSAEDFDAAAGLEDYLYAAGCEVLSPLIEGEPGAETEDPDEHRHNLLECDAAIIYYGQASDRWFRAKLREFDDIDADRTRPLLTKAVYLAAPDTRQKQRVKTRKATVIKNLAEFTPTDLQPFVAALKPARN